MDKLNVVWVRKITLLLCVVVIALVASALVVRGVLNSLLWRGKDRINVVIYEKNPYYISWGLKDGVHYQIPFYPDLRIVVPGGYGSYRVGALEKLVALEKQPEILRRAFSSASSTMVDFYFYPAPAPEVYYGEETQDSAKTPGFKQLFLYRSNAGLLDRVFLYLRTSSTQNNGYTIVDDLPVTIGKDGPSLREKDLFNSHLGYFYQSSYRAERRNVQIIYSKSYKAAENLGRIIEGNGIRVVDLTRSGGEEKRCRIREVGRSSATAKELARFLRCATVTGETGTSDIIITLGDREGEWE